jgi:regulator of RNase E activity RraB
VGNGNISTAFSAILQDAAFGAFKMGFEIYIPENLTFQDYLAICQCARTLADAYDRKVRPYMPSEPLD